MRSTIHLLTTDLKKEVDADPENVDARMGLARTYVAKLLGVPAGPEKGIWSGKAEALWREVLEVEPDNWEARHSIASALSFYPPFLNKTSEAIREFEQLIEIQQRASEPTDNFPATYVSLARLHQTDGNPASALEVLEQGLERHPDDAAITERLRVLRSSFQFEDEADPSPDTSPAPTGEDQ